MTSLEVGRRVGTFVLRELLGGTALAVVYRALDEATAEEVGLKLLRGYFTMEPDLTSAFLAEMERVRSLEHPSILTPLGSGSEGSNVWVVLPFVPWRTLHQRIESQGGPLPPWEAVPILQSIADGLEYAHDHGMVHLDLKPGNIFVGDSSQVQVEGFGMVTLAIGVHPSMRVTLNTPHPTYMAPEQAESLDSRDPAHDVYALATMAYELLTGTVPFFGAGEAAIVRKRTGLPPVPSLLNPALPTELDSVLLRALHRHPSERFSSAISLVESLRGALGPLTETPAPPPVGAFVIADVESEAAPGVYEGPEVICISCGLGNPAGQIYCQECWNVLFEEFQPTRVEADTKRRNRARKVLRGRLMRRVGIPVVAVVISLVMYGQIAGFTHSVPAAFSTMSSVSAPGEWAMQGLDFAHTSGSAQGPVIEGNLAWSFDTDVPMLASPAVADGRVYLPTGDRRIVALAADDGRLIWEFPTTGPADSSPAVVADGTVYVGLRDGRILALAGATGALQWEYQTANPIMGPPVVHQGVVYVGSGDGLLYGVDARTGEFLWSYDTLSWISSGPALQDNMVVVTNHQGWAYVVDWTTGEKRLSYDAYTSSISSPVFVGDDILVGLGNGRLLAIDSRSLEYPLERRARFWRGHFFLWGLQSMPPIQKGFSWTKRLGGREARLTTPAVLDGVAYVGASDGKFWALDLDTRDAVWEYQADGAITGAPIAVGSATYFGTSRGTVVAVDRRSGELLWEFQAGAGIDAQPVLAGGTLYATSLDGAIYAIR